MELYDKKYVYFDWDDKLEGKKVILAHTIEHLKEFVNSCDNEYRFFSIQKGTNLPFSNGTCDCEFAYYDPYYEYRRAYLEGKQLQYKDGDGNWEDVIGEPTFTIDEYRIKPNEIKYVPFNTVQELIDCWDNKYPQNKSRPKGTMPLIWIKEKKDDSIYLITEFYPKRWSDICDVSTTDGFLSFEKLFREFTFLDDSIIGKVEK